MQCVVVLGEVCSSCNAVVIMTCVIQPFMQTIQPVFPLVLCFCMLDHMEPIHFGVRHSPCQRIPLGCNLVSIVLVNVGAQN